MIRFILVLASLVGILTGCQTIGSLAKERVSIDWTTRLYDIETFAFRPEERGEAAYVADSFAGSKGLVIIPSKDRIVRAVRAHNGEEIWRATTGGANVAAPVPIDSDVLVASTDGRLYRFNRRSGREVWSVDVPGSAPMHCSPIVSGDAIFVTTMENRIASLDASTGQLRWERKRPSHGTFTISGHAGVLEVGDSVVTGFNDGWLIAFAKSDGATLWSMDLAAEKKGFVDVDSTPVLSGSKLIVSSYNAGIYAIDAASQEVVWRIEGQGFQTPVLVGDMLYVATATGMLHAIDVPKGDVVWRKRVAKSVASRPLATRKYVLLPTSGGLLVLNRRTGTILSRLGDSHGFTSAPLLVNGTLYAFSNSGRFYALGIH